MTIHAQQQQQLYRNFIPFYNTYHQTTTTIQPFDHIMNQFLHTNFTSLLQHGNYTTMYHILYDIEYQLQNMMDISMIEDIMYHPTILLDYPMEQYLAIFGPFLFPLLVPIFGTWIREYIRYRKLRRKKVFTVK